jgi:hypothetical protein
VFTTNNLKIYNSSFTDCVWLMMYAAVTSECVHVFQATSRSETLARWTLQLCDQSGPSLQWRKTRYITHWHCHSWYLQSWHSLPSFRGENKIINPSVRDRALFLYNLLKSDIDIVCHTLTKLSINSTDGEFCPHLLLSLSSSSSSSSLVNFRHKK